MSEETQNAPVPEENAALLPADGEAEALGFERLPERQYCIFRAGRERYCLAVLDVEEVLEWPQVTRIPM